VGAAGVAVISHDLAGSVDADGFGGNGGQGMVESGVSSAAVEEAVFASTIEVIPSDLARAVDAGCIGA
jgi:hypothetical protein